MVVCLYFDVSILSDVTFTNGDYNKSLIALVKHIATEMCCGSGVVAHPYKLLLYGPQQHFNVPHRDTGLIGVWSLQGIYELISFSFDQKKHLECLAR
jgi:hypothetical protein